MKIFNSLQELWDYISYCPICQVSCRTIFLYMNPDSIFLGCTFLKNKNLLVIDSIIRSEVGKNLSIRFTIDCLTSKVDIVLPSSSLVYNRDSETLEEIESVLDQDCYFDLQSKCNRCNNAFAYGKDIKINFYKNNISSPFLLEKELVTLHISSAEIYSLTQDYSFQKTRIVKSLILDDGSRKTKSVFNSKLLEVDLSSCENIFKK